MKEGIFLELVGCAGRDPVVANGGRVVCTGE